MSRNVPPPDGGPSSTTWRRERLLHLGGDTAVPEHEATTPSDIGEPAPSETTSLQQNDRNNTSYGTVPSHRHTFDKTSFGFSSHRGLPQLPNLNFLHRTTSNPPTPRSPSAFRDLAFSRLSLQRPISSYDAPLRSKDGVETDADAKTNGIRVWYSSFSSIDWLHDAIKDSVRFSRLRRRKSLRARVRLAIDKSLGWFIVTIVGFLTAVVAFLIVRSEQWLFDTKDGYCRDSWWKAKAFCCPDVDEIRTFGLPSTSNDEGNCLKWRKWSDVFSGEMGGLGDNTVDYLSYAFIAVRLVLTASMKSVEVLKTSFLLGVSRSDVRAPHDLFDKLHYFCHPQRIRRSFTRIPRFQRL